MRCRPRLATCCGRAISWMRSTAAATCRAPCCVIRTCCRTGAARSPASNTRLPSSSATTRRSKPPPMPSWCRRCATTWSMPGNPRMGWSRPCRRRSTRPATTRCHRPGRRPSIVSRRSWRRSKAWWTALPACCPRAAPNLQRHATRPPACTANWTHAAAGPRRWMRNSMRCAPPMGRWSPNTRVRWPGRSRCRANWPRWARSIARWMRIASRKPSGRQPCRRDWTNSATPTGRSKRIATRSSPGRRPPATNWSNCARRTNGWMRTGWKSLHGRGHWMLNLRTRAAPCSASRRSTANTRSASMAWNAPNANCWPSATRRKRRCAQHGTHWPTAARKPMPPPRAPLHWTRTPPR